MNVIINGQTYLLRENKSILDVAKDIQVDVPSLCSISKHDDKQSCDLCVVEVVGKGIVKACETKIQDGMTIVTQSAQINNLRRQALNKIFADHNADCEAPCKVACPAHVDIQTYLHHIAQGDHHEAVKIIKDTLPMPISIGRVCPAFCEHECRRTLVDEPLAIRQLKRHAADIDLSLAEQFEPPKLPYNGHRVAIVGAGPGGLACGYYLSYQGFAVDVFESMPEAGGWLRYGIPEYRLPKDILDKEIELMCRGGMRIHTNTLLGKDIALDELTDNYEAVCLAVGATKAVNMPYPGSDLEGCVLGVDFLKDHMTDKTFTIGKKVAVIGGGNTAIDCARTAIREGAETTIIYRRTRNEMPAELHEIEAAELEGVKFKFLTNPKCNLADSQGRVEHIELEIMELGEPDSSGRRRPVSTGKTETVAFDTVISALSQKPDVEFLKSAKHPLPLTDWGTASSDGDSMHHGYNVYSVGDFRRGPATAIEAIADGKKAADAIERYILQGHFKPEPRAFNSHKAERLSEVRQTEYLQEKAKARAKAEQLSVEACQTTYQEVELGMSDEKAIAEAARCLECGCQANTQCDLRDYATEYKVDYREININQRKMFPVDKTSEFIVFDANRCISCGSCVHACQTESVHGILNFSETSHRPSFPNGATMGDSNCVQCGACVQVCPTGALSDKRDKSHGRIEMLTPVKTICTYCGVGCRVELYVDAANNKIRYVKGDKTSPVNQGMLCVKGRFGFDFIQSEERLSTPLIRKAGELVPASWDETVQYVADKLSKIKSMYGSDSLAGFSSAKTTNEDNYAFQKLFRREIGTNNIDHCARLCHSSTVTGLEAAFGSGAMTNDIPSIKHSDVIFIIGSDTSAAHPIIASHIKQAVADGATLIVADPKRIDMVDHAKLYVRHRPGTDVMLLNSIMHVIDKNSWQDDAYIEERTEGYSDLLEEIRKESYSPANAALVTGVAAFDIERLAELIGTAKVTSVFYSMGITQHTTGHDNVRSIANLQMLCGNVGVEGGGINPLRGQSNVQGSCDMGALPTDYPGYQKVTNPEVQAKFAKAWNSETLPTEKGKTLTEIIDGACDGDIKALYVMGENPVLSDPDQAHAIHGLKSLDFLVVQDIFLTETAQLADVVLPSYSFAEKAGHFTNTERRVQRLVPAVQAPGEAKEDWRIIQEIANAMGSDWAYQTVQDITEEIADVTPQYHGIRWQSIGGNGLQWPCNEVKPFGTRIMHKDQFVRGKGAMKAIPFEYAAELPDDEYPLILTTGRLLEQFHTGTMTRKTKGLDNLAGPRIMVSVEEAERLGITNGETVKLVSRRGEISAPAFVTKRMQQGVVFVPFHFAESAANKLTNTATDPYAKIPEFKVSAVRLEAVTQPVH
ncbi:formate dehydrogenase subunit alpha [Vibrio mediterranei]|uniref:formate dehydrogenase subunit alpha n=1 Tax=Vibrio mediterranei TaxID=689 RepID=UPI001EFE746E|nr:formate dehydrogenase subunit alpha [Vibrio mediterranei]MCG9664558.1 formate dehydrogenase subunit alpha [Vibrio mediterranei]